MLVVSDMKISFKIKHISSKYDYYLVTLAKHVLFILTRIILAELSEQVRTIGLSTA